MEAWASNSSHLEGHRTEIPRPYLGYKSCSRQPALGIKLSGRVFAYQAGSSRSNLQQYKANHENPLSPTPNLVSPFPYINCFFRLLEENWPPSPGQRGLVAIMRSLFLCDIVVAERDYYSCYLNSEIRSMLTPLVHQWQLIKRAVGGLTESICNRTGPFPRQESYRSHHPPKPTPFRVLDICISRTVNCFLTWHHQDTLLSVCALKT